MMCSTQSTAGSGGSRWEEVPYPQVSQVGLRVRLFRVYDYPSLSTYLSFLRLWNIDSEPLLAKITLYCLSGGPW